MLVIVVYHCKHCTKLHLCTHYDRLTSNNWAINKNEQVPNILAGWMYLDLLSFVNTGPLAKSLYLRIIGQQLPPITLHCIILRIKAWLPLHCQKYRLLRPHPIQYNYTKLAALKVSPRDCLL